MISIGGCSRTVDQAAEETADQQVDTTGVETSEQPASEGSGGQGAAQGAGAAPEEDSQEQASGAPGGGSRERQASGAPGLPGDRRDGAEAVGAPIKIPSFLDDEGRPLNEVKAELEAALKDECGGELCVTLRVEFSDANHTRCEFARTEPAQDTEVPRKSTVVIVAGSQLCTPPSSDDPPPSSSEVPPSSSEVPPSSSEVPPSSSDQSPPDSSSGDLPTSSS
jgi:hypothetical protein